MWPVSLTADEDTHTHDQLNGVFICDPVADRVTFYHKTPIKFSLKGCERLEKVGSAFQQAFALIWP